MSGQLPLFERPAPAAPGILAAALVTRDANRYTLDDGDLDLSWIRCPHHGIHHWRGIRCPRCLFHTTTVPDAVLAYGSAARREQRRQQLGEGAGH